MSTSYPSGLDNFTNPTGSDYEDVVSHAGQHANANDAIEAIESTLGTTAGTAVIDNFSAGERAVAIAGTATLKNVDAILDEDDMASDSATALVTQQSVKAMHDTGWTAITETLTYASATTITVASGAASRYQKGDKLKITQTTDKYFYIVGVADTVLTVTGGSDYTLANEEITSPQLSRIENPFGFPGWFSWTSSIGYGGGNTNPTSNTINEARFKIQNTEVSFYLKSTIVKGSGNRSYITYSLPVNYVSSGNNCFYSIENIIQANFYPRAVYNQRADDVAIDLTAVMARDGVVSISGFYEF